MMDEERDPRSSEYLEIAEDHEDFLQPAGRDTLDDFAEDPDDEPL